MTQVVIIFCLCLPQKSIYIYPIKAIHVYEI